MVSRVDNIWVSKIIRFVEPLLILSVNTTHVGISVYLISPLIAVNKSPGITMS